jgi:hypothetical protein
MAELVLDPVSRSYAHRQITADLSRNLASGSDRLPVSHFGSRRNLPLSSTSRFAPFRKAALNSFAHAARQRLRIALGLANHNRAIGDETGIRLAVDHVVALRR